MNASSIPEDSIEFTVNAISIHQPIGDFLIASIPSKLLCDIAYFDMRRMLKERDIETYLGIQRPLLSDRVSEIQTYVRTIDACFPTAIILAVDSRAASFDADKNKLTLHNVPNPEEGYEPIYYKNIAKILDGQHRIAGLINYPNDDFEVNVSIFIDADIEDQAYIFSTVNLAQTKVNRSLAYDLSELSKTRSPQKSCHNIAVALDQLKSSPFHERIRRLGTATPGRSNEKLNQATFVESLLEFISISPIIDRDIIKRGNTIPHPSQSELERLPFRSFFIDNEDMKIADVLYRYFSAVKEKWPNAWSGAIEGSTLNKASAFRALMRTLRLLCVVMQPHKRLPTQEDFQGYLNKVNIDEVEFNIDVFKPGAIGERDLYIRLINDMQLSAQKSLI